MSRETDFYIYSLERYRFIKGLTGAEAASLFEENDIYGYISQYFEVLHTMSDQLIVQDIDEYIADRKYSETV